MKNLNLYAILLVILFWDVPAAAQKNLISRGDRQAELKNYAGAIYLYENAYEKNPESRELIEKLATSYRLTNQYAKALDFYGLLMARGNTGKEDAIHYADLLLRNGNIGSAREELEKLLKQYPGDEGIVLLMKNCDFADAQMASLSVKKEDRPSGKDQLLFKRVRDLLFRRKSDLLFRQKPGRNGSGRY